MLGLYGRGLSRNYVHNFATISEIEALPETEYAEVVDIGDGVGLTDAVSEG